jgi:hypothetical protein
VSSSHFEVEIVIFECPSIGGQEMVFCGAAAINSQVESIVYKSYWCCTMDKRPTFICHSVNLERKNGNQKFMFQSGYFALRTTVL